MIQNVTAVEFVRAATNGRTGPLIMVCETGEGEHVELFCKFSAGCDETVSNLAREAIAVCLAADLRLPVPVPYLVSVPPEICDTMPDEVAAARVRRSVPIAFGSTRANQFSAWTTGHRVSEALLPVAAATLAFDGIIQNPDRRADNPNCLVRGDDIRLIDHELAFAHRLILFWRPPWVAGGMESLVNPPGRHIFMSGLSKREIDFDPITTAWTALSDERLRAYQAAIPLDWSAAKADIDAAVALIADARANIDGCIAEVRRILS